MSTAKKDTLALAIVALGTLLILAGSFPSVFRSLSHLVSGFPAFSSGDFWALSMIAGGVVLSTLVVSFFFAWGWAVKHILFTRVVPFVLGRVESAIIIPEDMAQIQACPQESPAAGSNEEKQVATEEYFSRVFAAARSTLGDVVVVFVILGPLLFWAATQNVTAVLTRPLDKSAFVLVVIQVVISTMHAIVVCIVVAIEQLYPCPGGRYSFSGHAFDHKRDANDSVVLVLYFLSGAFAFLSELYLHAFLSGLVTLGLLGLLAFYVRNCWRSLSSPARKNG